MERNRKERRHLGKQEFFFPFLDDLFRLEWCGICFFIWVIYTDTKENQIFLIIKEIQSGAVAKSYMRKGFLILCMKKCANISPYIRRPLVIYDFAPDRAEFPNIWGKLDFLFISVLSDVCPEHFPRSWRQLAQPQFWIYRWVRLRRKKHFTFLLILVLY